MKVVYVAGPYRAATPRGIVENIREAEKVALGLWRMGFAVICPHKNTALFDGAAPDDIWLEGALELMRRSDGVVLVPNWQHSTGTLAEVVEAERLGLPVWEWPIQRSVLASVLETA